MTKHTYYSIFFTVVFFNTSLIYSQSLSKGKVKISSHHIENHIKEVYVFNSRGVNQSKSKQYNAVKKLLEERLFFFESTTVIDKAIDIGNVPLFNKYNSTLIRDNSYDIDSFNPLKYNLPFFSNYSSLYRLGSTNFYLLIKGQKIIQN